MKGPIKAVLAIYTCASVFTYGSFFFFPQFVSLSFSGRLIWSIVGFSGLFLSVIVVSKLFIGEWKTRRIGWVKENFSMSFLWISALCFPVTLGNLVRAHVVGASTVIESFGIGISAPYSFWLPLFAITFWSFSGATSFSFLQAFPYESLREYPKKYILPSIALLFILQYNAPLVTGEFNPGDILWLGTIFLLIYHRFRNSLSLILAYVTLYEFPVLWCFGAAWGEAAFFTVLYARVAWSGIAASTLALFKLKGKMDFAKAPNNLEVSRGDPHCFHSRNMWSHYPAVLPQQCHGV
ncbi:hypothetical protein AKJ66_00085 [candidate division MSBL1 archaeon SCGC-AAA259E22]|uniref:Uncharacterized protein n=1 Tax=candidate division MSBL1 archaeon SCGC-AAA259E22 TaxID=1698265 RepID=A0A133UIK1_9EURY|nr:hypothetical protein AKJ66_00085 [candidate division MSBL1 archaeon SCGC-AAA259E22]